MTTPTHSSSSDGPDGPVAERLRREIADAAARVDALEAEYGALLADPGVIQEDRDAHRALLTGARETLATARAALDHVGSGDYGRCERCGEQIPAERLEAVPDALTCVACAV
jgi:DnaK suppressor protein